MMKLYSILVADGARARFFSLEGRAPRTDEAGPGLVEHEDRANPEHELQGRDKYSTTRTGVNLNPGKGPTHGYDDHRDQEAREHERRFAHDVARHAVDLAVQHKADYLVVAAEKRMLGLLREALQLPPHTRIEVRELAQDLTRLSVEDLHAHLAGAGVVPEHQARVGS